MKESDVHNYARHLYGMMGEKAEVYAAQQQAAFDRSRESIDTRSMRKDWHRIREALLIMKQSGSRYMHH